MPFRVKRSAFTRRKFIRSRPRLASWLKRGVKRSRAMSVYRRPETKHIDISVGPTVPAVGGTVAALNNGIAQGIVFNQRNGNAIQMIAMNYKIYAFGPSGGALATAQDCGEWAFVIDKGGLGVAPIWSDIFDTATNPIGMQDKNIAVNLDRFVILRRGNFVVGAANAAGCEPYYTEGVIRFPTKLSRVNYAAAAAAIPPAMALYFVVASVNNTANSATCLVYTLASRLMYYDV